MFSSFKMSSSTICVAICLIIYPVLSTDMKAKSSDKYGPFTQTTKEVEVCRGPKAVDLAEVTASFSKNSDNITMGAFSYNITRATKIEEMRIKIYNMKSDKKNLLWNYILTDPCKHFAVGAILALHLKPEKCVVKPGIYDFSINVTDATHKFFGDTFFYGDYFFKSIALSKAGNLGCLMFHQVFEKKVVN